MPSIEVVPEYRAESVGGPVIAGIEFRRPTSRDETLEPVRTSVELGNGSTRTYSKGVRKVFSLSWAKLTEDEARLLETTLASPFVTYRNDGDSPEYVVGTNDGASLTPVAATFPVRYAVSVTLRERDVR